MAKEDIKISIQLVPGFCPFQRYEITDATPRKVPEFSVKLNEQDLTPVSLMHQEQTLEYQVQLDEGEYCLSINLYNKNDDTIVDENGKIIHDLYIKIEKLMINDIEITSDLQNITCTYELEKPIEFRGNTVSNLEGSHTFMSWNGSWKFKFKSPFYLWLLDTL